MCGLGIAQTGFAQELDTKASSAEAAKVSFVAIPKKAGAAYQAGLVIAMTPGSHTYWKQPGDAGVPPTFTFDQSSNLAKAEVLYPVPSRIGEDGIVAFGYADRVVFPLLLTPANPAKPTTLHVDISYAVCSKICVPERATAELRFPLGPAVNDEAAVAAAFARVPEPLPAEGRGGVTLQRVAAAAKPTWTVTWTGKLPVDDVFPEAPDGYAFDVQPSKQANTWLLSESEPVPNGGKPLPVVLTFASKDRGFTVTEMLDLSPPKP